jgi:hypothetical protein
MQKAVFERFTEELFEYGLFAFQLLYSRDMVFSNSDVESRISTSATSLNEDAFLREDLNLSQGF